MNEVFSYVIGRPWGEDEGVIKAYATHNTQVKSGDLEDAENFKEYVERCTGEKEYIYKLVKID